jgi:hypothetical protein
VVVTLLVLDDSDEPSLGDRVATVTTAPTGSSSPTTSPAASAGTIIGIEPLALDADRLLADPCAVLTEDVRAMLALAATPQRDSDRRCIAGSGSGAAEVEMQVETADPLTAGADFQERYGGAPVPVANLGDASFQIRQGERTLVVVFSTGMSVWILVPTLEIEDPLVLALRAALV